MKLHTKIESNTADLDDLIESIEIKAAHFHNGTNQKELVLKPCIGLSYVRYNLGSESLEKVFEDAGKAVEFYNLLKF